MITKIVRIKATSRWFYALSDAQDDVDDKLERKEIRKINQLERDGYEYSQGMTKPYRDTFDKSRNKYKSSAEQILYFRKINSENLIEKYIQIPLGPNRFSILDNDKIDIENILTEKIKTKIPNKKTTKEVKYKKKIVTGRGVAYQKKTPYTVNVDHNLSSLAYNKLEIKSSNLELGKLESIGLPLSDTVYRWPYSNCGSIEQSFSHDFEYEIRKGYTIEFEKTIESTTTISLELGFNLEIVDGGVAYEGSKTITIRNSNRYTEEESESRRENFEFKVAPNTENVIELAVQQFQARRSFKGTAVINGKVIANYGLEKNTYIISELLNEDERTIDLKGFYSNLDFREIPIKITEKPCE